MRKIDIIKNRLQQIWHKYGDIIILSFLVFAGIGIVLNAYQTPEDELIERIMNERVGGRASGLKQLVVLYWGKPGYIVLFIFVTLGFIYGIWWTIQKLRCIERRNNLIHEGKLSIWDTNFGFEKISLWRSIKNLFRRKKDKYPSEREMRDALKKNKYYKEKDMD